MKNVTPGVFGSLASLALLAACGTDRELPTAPSLSMAADHRMNLERLGWSEPEWLGPLVNSPARDNKATLLNGGRTLYLNSDRVGGSGALDIWVSQRAHRRCPWQAPVNLGPPLNTPAAEGAPNFSPDERVLFFSSQGHRGHGGADIFLSRRDNPSDDFGWQPPVNLGPDVNTSADETGPFYFQHGKRGGQLYFTRGNDIYVAPITRDLVTLGPAVAVSELNDPAVLDASPSIRANGKELIFWSSNRTGGLGGADLWVSTRQSVKAPWSAPLNLGAPVNTEFAELEPTLSRDGRTLVFSAGFALGGLGLSDLWMSTRGPDREDNEERDHGNDGDHNRRCADRSR